jgi:hypothetical protein
LTSHQARSRTGNHSELHPNTAQRREPPVTSNPAPAPWPRLRVNLSTVRSHYAYANRRHTLHARRHANFLAISDIPALIAEIERLWAVACDACQRYANLRAAALASIAASQADEPDPLFYLRDELRASGPQRPRPRGRR